MTTNGKIMEFMTVEEVIEGLKETRTILLPEGVMEQHGYHLPLNVDVYNAYEVAKRVGAAANCFVAPPIYYTYSGGELPGTFNIHPATLQLYLGDIFRSMINMGMRNIVIVLGHGGSENQTATRDAIDMFMRLNPDVQEKDVLFGLMPFVNLTKYVTEAFEERDYHAGNFETSLMLHWHPELVAMDKMRTDCEEMMATFRIDPDAYQVRIKPMDHEFVMPYVRSNPQMKIGVMGDPSPANAAYGERICEDIVRTVAGFVDMIQEKHPGFDRGAGE